MASKPGGYSGGDRGPMGSHTGPNSASGTGFSKADGGFSKGMQGATARRTSAPARSYEGSLHNFGQLAKEVVGFMGGPVTTAAKAIAGYGPSYQGYTGHVNTPGFADPTNRALGQEGFAGASGARRGGLYQNATPIRPNIAKAQALMPAPAPAPLPGSLRAPFAMPGHSSGSMPLRNPFKAA